MNEKSNYNINDRLLYNDFNEKLQFISSTPVELINVLNKYYRKDKITVNNVNYDVIGTNSPNEVVYKFLDESFTDLITSLYLNPSLDEVNYVMQDYNIFLYNETIGDSLKIKKKYYDITNKSYENESYLYFYEIPFTISDSNDRLISHSTQVEHPNTNYGQHAEKSGWADSIKIPTFYVYRNHIDDKQTNYKLGQVIVNYPDPYKNLVFNGSANNIGNGYNISLPNLLSINITIFFKRAATTCTNISYDISRQALESTNGVKLYIYNKEFTLVYSGQSLTISYNNLGSNPVPDLIITASVF